MPGPVERWLETFMCKQYANIFEGFGFKTLQSVCQLQPTQLQAMGIPQEYCEKILENVHVLRQTLSGTMNYPEEMSGNLSYGSSGNGMSHPSHPSMGYPNPDSNPMAMMSQYAAMQGYREQVQNPTMMSPPHYPNASSMYRSQQQQHQLQQQQQQFMSQQINSMYNNQNFNPVPDPMLMNSMGGANPMYCRSSGNTSQGAGSPSIHPPPHPHLRQGGLSQNPQQVADNILQMASSTYSAQTVQVPLNKGRSAPYHNPRTNYSMANLQNITGLPSNMSGIQGGLSNPHNMGSVSNMMPIMPSGKSNMQVNTSRQMMQPAGSPSRLARSSGQYGYTNSSPHPHQPRTSPISPMPMHSPVSQHSNHSVQNNPSPGPLQSPVGGSIHSPVSPMTSVGGMHSPHTKQTHMTSPSHSQTMRSPIQQMKHINSPMMNCTPVPSPGSQVTSGTLRSPHSQSSQLHSPHQQYYPHIQQTSQPQSHYSPASQCVNSPISHTSSPPYIQSSGHVSPSMSLPSPHSAVSRPSPSGSTSSINYNTVHQPLSVPQKGSALVNPLQSLEKLVMLPETQVVDPKSVVNDDCLSSHSTVQVIDGLPKNCDRSSDLIPSRGGQLEIKHPLEGNYDNLSTGNAFQPTQNTDSAADAVTTSLDISFTKTPEQRLPESDSTTLIKPSLTNSLNSKDFTQAACKNLSQLSPVISPAVEQFSSKQNSPDTSNHTMNSKCDNIIQGTAKKEEKRKKQENMSPKKRFLGSQPLLNGNSVSKPLPVSHNSKSEININGPETMLSVNNISKSVNSEDTLIKSSVGNRHVDDNSITETYVSKKLKQKRMIEKNAGFSSMTTGDIESNGQSGPVSCAVSGVIQATPRFGTAVYDDVSEASDLEEGELSVRKDSVKTYTRDALLSSPLKNSIHKSYKRYDADSDDSLHEENIVVPFRDEQFQDKKDLFYSLEKESPPLKKDKKSPKVLLNHQKSRSISPLSDSSEKSKSPNMLDEVDTKNFPRSRLNSKSNPNNTNPQELFVKSLPKESPTKLSSTLDSNQESQEFSDDSCDQSPPMSPGEISWADIINPKSNSSSRKTEARTLNSDPQSAKKRLSENKDSCEEIHFHNSPEIKFESEDSEETVVKRKSRKKTETSKFLKVRNCLAKGNSNVNPANTSNKRKSHKKLNSSVREISQNSSACKKSKTVDSSDVRTTKVENDRIEIISEEDSIDATDIKQVVKKSTELASTSDVEVTPGSSYKSLDSHDTPFRKKRGRPPGSKNKIKTDKKHSKPKRDDTVYNSDDERKGLKSSEKVCPPTVPTMKRRKDTSVPNSGPFIRLQEDKCVIMNASLEDVESKPVKKKKPSKTTGAPSASLSVQISNLPSDRSVLVPAASPCDESLWYCCICRKHSSYKFLGDLFGPYYAEGYQPAQSNDDRSDKPKQRRKKMFVLADQVPNYADLITKPVKTRKQSGDRKLGLSPPFDFGAIDDSDELWVHEDCALWSDGVYLIENNIYGLQEAANIAASATCSSCKEVGASIGCLHKGCSQKYHYVCAIEKDCYLDEENFSLVCLKHKDKRTKTTDQTSRKVS